MRTLIVAAIAAMATALHAEEPPRGFNESHYSGIHDITVLLALPYDYVPLCPPPKPAVMRPGQIPLAFKRTCESSGERWDRHLRQLFGDPGRH